MIETSNSAVEHFKETPPSGGFRVQPPSNPLVASSSLSLLKNDAKVSIEWGEDKEVPTDKLLSKVRQEFVLRSRKDVAKRPNSARTHANLGIALMNQGELEEALKELRVALSLDPHHYVAGVTLAKIMVEQGEFDEAEKLYSKMREAFPEDSAPVLSLALIAMKKFDFENAERLFRCAIALDENSILPKYLLAIVLIRLERNREAISLLKAAAHSEVRSPALYQALGVAYAMAKDRGRAELNFRTALTLAPTMSEAIYGLARVLIEEGKESGALSLLTEHLERMPEDNQARELLARAYHGIGQYRSAAHQLIQVFNRLPETAETSVITRRAQLAALIGHYYAMDQKAKEAENWLVRAVRFTPKRDAIPYQNLGRLYLREDRVVDAFRILTECKALFPENQTTYDLLARVYVREGYYDDAVRVLEPLVQEGKAETSIYNALGLVLDYKGDSVGAEKVLKEGHAKYPSDRSIIHNLGYVFLMNGKVVDGKQVLEHYRNVLNAYAQEDADYDAILTATWGLVHLLEGDVDLGIKFYKQASKVAYRAGTRDLAAAILQKMHIEVSKLLLSKKDYGAARREIMAGLSIKRGREPYKRELNALKIKLDGMDTTSTHVQ
jgi:Flp pilus assembly protein TadD